MIGSLAVLRGVAERLLTDTCRITKPGEGDPVYDPSTGTYVDPPPVTLYEGPCRFPPRSISVTDTETGGETWRVGEFPLEVTVTGSDDVAVGHTVEYLTAEHDPSLVGRMFGIVAPDRQSQAVTRRFRVKEVVG